MVFLQQGDTGAAYGYNASGIRVSKQVGDTYTYYLLDGGDVVAEYTDGSLSAHYVRGINLIRGKFGSTTRYYLHDAHGDVTALTNSSGAVTKRYSYDAFGNEENPSSDANPFRYCGEYFDKETQTYYLRARYYDPAIGRFTQQDSLLFTTRKLASGYEYADPLSLNLYAYCHNNPVAHLDPSGHVPFSTLNKLSFSYNNNMVSIDYVSEYILTHTGANLHLAFHQIAQVNLAKKLYGLGYIPFLEFRIYSVGRVDIVAGNMAWEVKAMPLSGAKQMEKYMNSGGFQAGHEFAPILDIPLFDNFKMGILPSMMELGVAHYFFYWEKDGEYKFYENVDVIAAYQKKKSKKAKESSSQATGHSELLELFIAMLAFSGPASGGDTIGNSGTTKDIFDHAA